MEERKEHFERFDLDLFTNQITAELYICGICLQIPHPRLTTNHAQCGAIFCESCVRKWLRINPLCPKCRKQGTINLINRNNVTLYMIQIKLELHCPISKNCSWKGNFHALDSHQEVCRYVSVRCPVLGCFFSGTREEFANHMEVATAEHARLSEGKMEDAPMQIDNYIKTLALINLNKEEKKEVVPSILAQQRIHQAQIAEIICNSGNRIETGSDLSPTLLFGNAIGSVTSILSLSEKKFF